MGEDKHIFLSEKFYLCLKRIITLTLISISYNDGQKIIIMKDENKGTNYVIELIEINPKNEVFYFVRSIKSKYLQYNSNMNDKGIGKILRLESERNPQIHK